MADTNKELTGDYESMQEVDGPPPKEAGNAELYGPKYPNINVQLVGLDGNAFSILGRAQKAAKRGGLTKEQIEEFMDEAKSGDYDHLLQTTMIYFSTEGGDADWRDEDEDEYL